MAHETSATTGTRNGARPGQGPILKGNGDDGAIAVPLRLWDAGYEETPVALDVVLLNVGVPEAETDRHSVERLPVVVAEVFVGLDVVLVAVGPVEIDLLAVVGDGVTLVA